MSTRLFCAALGAVTVAGSAHAFDPTLWQLRTAVITGEQPSGVSRTINFPLSTPFAYVPSMSRSGQMLIPTNAGLFAWDLSLPSSGLRLVRETGTPIPSSAGVATTYVPPSAPVMDDALRIIGAVIVDQALNYSQSMNFVTLNGAVAQQFARNDMPPPNDVPGPNLRNLSLPSVASDGTTLFFGTPSSGGTGAELWKWSPTSGRSRVLGPGMQAPGFPIGWLMSEVQSNTWAPTMSRSGKTWVTAFLSRTNPGVTSDNSLVLFKGPSDNLQPLYRSGDVLPNGQVFRNFRAGSTNDAGDAVGLLYTGTGNSYQVAIFRGTQPFEVFGGTRPLPGIAPGTIVDFVTEMSLNNSGKVAFAATYRPNASEGIWFGDENDLRPVALTGSSIPQWSDLVVRDIARGPFFNNRNDIVFVGNVQSLSSMSVSQALLYWTPQMGLTGLLRSGEQFEVRPGIFKTVESFMLMNASGVQDGYSIFLNDFGHFAFGLRFTDGTAGSFGLTVPSASTVSLLAISGVLALRRRRH